jgi:hypothetical protein
MAEKRNQQKSSDYNILSIIGFIFAFVFPPAGFVLGIIALSQIKRTNEKGRGLAIAAIVLGALFLLFLIMMVVIGIAWIAIRNTIGDDGALHNLDFTSKCLNTEVVATQVTNVGEAYSVTLSKPEGEYEIGGVKLVFTNDEEGNSYVSDVPGEITDMPVQINIPVYNMSNPNKVSVVVYFLDENGQEQLCQTANAFAFA